MMAQQPEDVLREMRDDATWRVYPTFCTWWGSHGESAEDTRGLGQDITDAFCGRPHRESHADVIWSRTREAAEIGWESSWRSYLSERAVQTIDSARMRERIPALFPTAVPRVECSDPWQEGEVLPDEHMAAMWEFIEARRVCMLEARNLVRQEVYRLPPEAVPNESLVNAVVEWARRWNQDGAGIGTLLADMRKRLAGGELPIRIPSPTGLSASPAPGMRCCRKCPTLFEPITETQEFCSRDHGTMGDENAIACMEAWKRARGLGKAHPSGDRVASLIPGGTPSRRTVDKWMRDQREAIDAFEAMPEQDPRRAIVLRIVASPDAT